MPALLARSLGARFIAAALIAGAAGCSTIEAPPDTAQVLAEIPPERKPAKPYPQRLAIAPVQVALVTGDVAPNGGAKANGGAPAEGAATGEGSAPAAGAPAGAPPADSAPAGGKQGSAGPRTLLDGQVAMVRYRKPLFRELLFAPADGEVPADAPPPTEPVSPAAADTSAGSGPSHVLWMCPRCERPVSRTDTTCGTCFLPFAPEQDEAPVVATPEPAPAPTPPPTAGQPPAEPGEEVAAQPGDQAEPKPEATTAPPPEPAGKTAATPAQPTPTQPTADVAKADRFVCYLCGREVSPTVRECPICGLKLDIPEGYVAEGGGESLGTLATGEMVRIDSRRAAFAPDPQVLQKEIVAAVQGYNVFAEVVPITKQEIAGNKDALLALATDREVDYLLMPTVKRWEIHYDGLNWKFFPGFALWVAAWVPSWWVAGDTFHAFIEIEFKLLHVRSGREIPNWKTTYTGQREFQVDHFDRGWYPWGILGVPLLDIILGSGWRNLNEKLAPHALAELKKELINEGLYATFVQYGDVMTKWDFGTEVKPESHALLVGADLFNSTAIRPLRYTSADLDTMARALKEASGFHKVVRMEPRAAQASETPTTANIRHWLTGELQRRGRRDTVLIYFSGYGIAVKEKGEHHRWKDGYEKYFVTSDTDPANIPGTAFPLSELVDQLRAAKVGRALVILDCSFATSAPDETIGYGRTLPQIDTEAALRIEDPNALDFEFLDNMTLRGGGKNAVAIAACAMNETAMETEYLGDGHGVLTYFFADGIMGAADDRGNRDGQVDLEEVIADTIQQVKNFATRSGLAQTIQVKGNVNAMQMTLKRAAKTTEVGTQPSTPDGTPK